MNKRTNLFDYHTQALAHGRNQKLKIDETIEAAINCGLSAICLTDHFPLPKDYFDPTYDVRVSYPEYVEKVLTAKNRYRSQIEVLLGAEFDWISGYSNWIRNEIAKYPFDYVIGSVHYIFGGDGVYFPIDFTQSYFNQAVRHFGDMRKVVERYYSLVQDIAVSKLFDCVGHLDRIKVFNDGSLFDEQSQWYQQQVIQTLDKLATTKIVMEVNTSGFDRAGVSSYPSLWILKETKKRGIDITFGSDAHRPGEVGRYFDRAVELVKHAGYRELVRFVNREKRRVPIIT